MPTETPQAIEWAMNQDYYGYVVRDIYQTEPSVLVDNVRQYFNTHGIDYSTFDYNDLQPYL